MHNSMRGKNELWMTCDHMSTNGVSWNQWRGIGNMKMTKCEPKREDSLYKIFESVTEHHIIRLDSRLSKTNHDVDDNRRMAYVRLG